jgi:glycine/D-amino acid oxidase-like deaminating enzyme
VIGHCPVETIERDGAGFLVTTPKGRVRAGHVIVATNGYTPRATGWLRRRIVPVDAFMIATEPLPAAMIEEVMPGGRPMIENRYNPSWLRPSHDGTQILFGGASEEAPKALPRKAEQLHAMLADMAPVLRDVKLTHCWTGKTGFTFDMLPHTGSHDGVEYAMGWCGAGVPMGTYLGHKTALRVLKDPEARTVFDGRPFPTKPFYTGNPWMMPLVVAWYRRKDRKLFQGKV